MFEGTTDVKRKTWHSEIVVEVNFIRRKELLKTSLWGKFNKLLGQFSELTGDSTPLKLSSF